MTEKEETEQKGTIINLISYHHMPADRLKILKPHIGDMHTHIQHIEDLEYDEVEQYLLTLPHRTLRMIRRIYNLALWGEWNKMEYVFSNSIEKGGRAVLSFEECTAGDIETHFKYKYYPQEGEEQEYDNTTYEFAYVVPHQFNEITGEPFMYSGGNMLSDHKHFLEHFWRENNPYKFEYGMKLIGFEID